MGLFLVVLSLVLVTGCGSSNDAGSNNTNSNDNNSNNTNGGTSSKSKEYTCTYEDDEYKDTWTLTVDKDGNIIKAKEVASMTYDDKDELNDDYEEAKEGCEEYEDEGLKCTVKKNGMTITMTIEGTADDYDFDGATWDDIKESFEYRDYTCK